MTLIRQNIGHVHDRRCIHVQTFYLSHDAQSWQNDSW